MGQADVMEFLENNPNEWFTANEISDKLGLGKSSVTTSLRKIRGTREIEWTLSGRAGFVYRWCDYNDVSYI